MHGTLGLRTWAELVRFARAERLTHHRDPVADVEPVAAGQEAVDHDLATGSHHAALAQSPGTAGLSADAAHQVGGDLLAVEFEDHVGALNRRRPGHTRGAAHGVDR